MTSKILAREVVAEHLAVSTSLLCRYEARGLVHAVRSGDVVGYEPAEVRRIWTIVSLQRDLGVNLPGVEAVLQLKARVAAMNRQFQALIQALDDAAEHDRGTDSD